MKAARDGHAEVVGPADRAQQQRAGKQQHACGGGAEPDAEAQAVRREEPREQEHERQRERRADECRAPDAVGQPGEDERSSQPRPRFLPRAHLRTRRLRPRS